MIERADAAFPEPAKRAGVEGEVRFRAALDAAGRLQRVDIDAVPEPGLGFEEATGAALARWKFAPAKLRGVPVESEYAGSLHFELTLPGEAMFSASSLDTWTAMRAMVREMRIPVDLATDRTQLLTSGPVRYLALKVADPASLALPLGFTPNRITFHVYVAPGIEPAHVAVGTIMDIEPIASTDHRRFTVYGHEALSRWFLTELGRRLGVRMEWTAASAERRAQQAQALMPSGLSDPCSTAPAPLLQVSPVTGIQSAARVTAPKLMHEVKPPYPQDQLEARKMATIIFKGEITEHGTLVHPTMTEPANASPSFVASAQLAFGLWRFSPAQTNGCRVRVNGIFRSEFTIKN